MSEFTLQKTSNAKTRKCSSCATTVTKCNVQSCCFANLNLSLFCRSRCRRRRRFSSTLLLWTINFATMVTWHHIFPHYWLLQGCVGNWVEIRPSPLPQQQKSSDGSRRGAWGASIPLIFRPNWGSKGRKRGFAEKPSLLNIIFRIWLMLIVSFD